LASAGDAPYACTPEKGNLDFMAKRNTTGMPRKRRRGEDGESDDNLNLIQKLQKRASDEQQLQRMVIIGIGVVIGVLAILIAVALLWDQLVTPNQTVAVVDGHRITVSQFEERVRVERTVLIQRFNNDIALLLQFGQDPNQILQSEPYNTWWQELNSQPELLGNRVLNDMINEQIIREQAQELGVTVDDEQIQAQVKQFFNDFSNQEDQVVPEDATETPIPSDTPTPFVSPTPSRTPEATNTPEPTPTPLIQEEIVATDEGAEPTATARPTGTASPTPSQEDRDIQVQGYIDTFYRNARHEAGLDQATVRSYFENQALRLALRDVITADISSTAPYVNARHILVATEEEANNVLAALQAGESFADLARAVSTDTGSGARGGELGWSPANQYVPEFRDAVLAVDLDEIVGPVKTDFGYHIIQVRNREDREMSESELNQAKDQEFQQWLDEVTSDDNHNIVRHDNWPAHVPLDPVWNYRPPGVAPTNTPPPGL